MAIMKRELFIAVCLLTLAILPALGAIEMAFAMAEANSLISSDSTIHERLRSVVNRGFTPRKMAALEPRIRKIAQEAIDDGTRA